MFKKDMGSTAHDRIYDILELDNLLQSIGMYRCKDEPSSVRKVAPDRMEATMTLREFLEDEITAWLKESKKQENGTNDIKYIDELLNHQLSERGILQRAMEDNKKKKKSTI